MNFKRQILQFFLLLFSNLSIAQNFHFNIGKEISDFSGNVIADTIRFKITTLPKQVNNSFGLSKICFNISHNKTSDLKIELLSPNNTRVWLTNRNGGDEGSNFIGTCFRSNGFNGYIHQNKAPFSGEYTPDGRLDFINNGQDPNGEWKLLITDLKIHDSGIIHDLDIFFTENPNPNSNKVPCNLENGENCLCSDSSKICDLLPDLVILKQFTIDQIKEYPWNHFQYPRQLRLAATIANIGDGPIETIGKNEWYCGKSRVDSSIKCPNGEYARQILYQKIYYKKDKNLESKLIPTGTNYFDDKPGHNHFHVDSWVAFRLLKSNSRKKIIAKGQKVSYCLFDTGICNNEDKLCEVDGVRYGQKNLVNYGLGNFVDCKSGYQGISVGGYDTYGMLYEGQFIELPKNLKSGKYILEIEIDPENKYLEKDKSNNIYHQEVQISKQRKH
jgi:subtilisin-like proprotein convertase family protein